MSHYSVAIPSNISSSLARHLIRKDQQEDLCFALWRPSTGKSRSTAIITDFIIPQPGDRQVHGNASFNPKYVERAINKALEKSCGIAFMHSHLGPGWQDMSPDDISAEKKLSKTVEAATGLPLVGLTLATDQTWSARHWIKSERYWCKSVRVVGLSIDMSYNDKLLPMPKMGEEQIRTVSGWGEYKQAQLTRLKVGIVGCGSVGDMVAENLARIGVTDITLIDFDNVERKNLDRLLHATKKSIGLPKVQVTGSAIEVSATAADFQADTVPYSLAEITGYNAALDCDILFSCVDRPWPRELLNGIAYAHLIPVIDGGILIERTSKTETALRNAYWRAHTVGVGQTCLVCLGQVNPADALLERQGLLDDPHYIETSLPKHLDRHENVFTFSMAVASAEVMHFLSMIVSASGRSGLKPQRFSMFEKSSVDERACSDNCFYQSIVAAGDEYKPSIQETLDIAETCRKKARKTSNKLLDRLLAYIRSKLSSSL